MFLSDCYANNIICIKIESIFEMRKKKHFDVYKSIFCQNNVLNWVSQKQRKLKLILKTITRIILDLQTISQNHRDLSSTWKSSEIYECSGVIGAFTPDAN